MSKSFRLPSLEQLNQLQFDPNAPGSKVEKIMQYETGLRFLTDHLEGDTYFRIKRPGHNLDRCRTQFALVRSIEENAAAMRQIVADVAQQR